MAVDRGGEGSCIQAHDGVVVRLLAHGPDHLREIDAVLGVAFRPSSESCADVLQVPRPSRPRLRNFRPGRRGQRARQFDRIAYQAEIRHEVQPDHVIVGAGVHERLGRLRQVGKAVALAGNVAEAGAQREYQVALAEGVDLILRIRQPEFAHIERVQVGEQIEAPERQGDRDLPRLGQRAQSLASPWSLEPSAGDDQGTLRRFYPAQQ